MKKKTTIPKEPRERAHILRNTLYILSVGAKCAPFSLATIILSLVSYNVCYNAVLPVLFLKRAITLVESGGAFSVFAATVIPAVVYKVAVDLLDSMTEYRIRFHILCENVINTRLFQKAMEVETACYENPVFFDRFTRASKVVEQGAFKHVIEGSAWTLGSVISFAVSATYLVKTDPVMLFFALCPAVVLLIKTTQNQLNYDKEKEMTAFERKKDYVRRTVLLKDFAKEIKTTDIFSVLKRNFHEAVQQNITIAKKYGSRIAVLEMLSVFFTEIVPVGGGIVYACARLLSHNIALSDFSVFIAAVVTCRYCVKNLAYHFSNMQKQCLYVQALREFMDYKTKITGGSRHPGAFESLEFRNVRFRYDGAKRDSLHDVSFCIKKGEQICIVGYNGAGKTTLSKLILRLYDVTDGEILYNGVNIKEYNLQEYREKFATVFQDYKIFAMTVAENVLAREDVPQDEQTVLDALAAGGVKEKVDATQRGIHTLLTKEFDDEGAALSGGEGQKLAAARLFAKKAEIALADEPSSALDPIAEDRLYRNLHKATADKTSIFISHRLSGATAADRIFVFANATLAEVGDHETLLRQNGVYAQLFTLQASGYREEARRDA